LSSAYQPEQSAAWPACPSPLAATVVQPLGDLPHGPRSRRGCRPASGFPVAGERSPIIADMQVPRSLVFACLRRRHGNGGVPW